MVVVNADSRVKKQPEEGTRSYCLGLAEKIESISELPVACERFKNDIMRRRDTRSAVAIAFEGMRPGSAIEARAARATGRLNQHQLQRKYTTYDRFQDRQRKS